MKKRVTISPQIPVTKAGAIKGPAQATLTNGENATDECFFLLGFTKEYEWGRHEVPWRRIVPRFRLRDTPHLG